MGQTELVNKMAVEMGTTKKAAKEALDGVLNAIESGLAETGKVALAKFGVFEVRDMDARKGRNPQTQEEIEIPAYKKPAFKPAKALKELVNGEV